MNSIYLFLDFDGVLHSISAINADGVDYSDRWNALGFKTFGVGWCGVTDLEGRVVRPGDFDDAQIPGFDRTSS